MRSHLLMSICVVSMVSSVALADQLQGLVRVTGNAPFKQVTITKPSEFVGMSLCPGDKAKRIMNLESLIVKIYGAEKELVASKCFEVGSFTVLKTPAGNDAVVGTLLEKDGGFQLLVEDGRAVRLVNVPRGLRSMIGKKVVVDIKPEATLTSGVFQAVYYAEHP